LSAVKGTREGGVDFNIDDLTMNSMPQNVNMFGKSGQLELLIGLMF
jgi:hypothetical protein